MVETLALTIGKQIATLATKVWPSDRGSKAERRSDLTELLATRVGDQFSRRALAALTNSHSTH